MQQSAFDTPPEPSSVFLRACLGLPTERTPFWLMRQAGRYMPEYRRFAERYGFLGIVKQPELACEVTLQPITAFGMDAAVIFSDITPILEDMGLKLDIIKGDGPVITPPVRTAADIEALRVPAPSELMPYTVRAIELVKKELGPKGIPVIGFAGAPFTLAAYAVEGERSTSFLHTKALMLSEPVLWHQLMSKLAKVIGEYLAAQARAGAEALQLFDTWVGCLSQADYRKHVLPYSREALAIASRSGVPVIHFGLGGGSLIEPMCEAGGDVIGIDWRVDVREAFSKIGARRGVQGNLDPSVLLGPPAELRRQALALLETVSAARPRRQGYVFNLGHGILPQTPPDSVRVLADTIRQSALA